MTATSVEPSRPAVERLDSRIDSIQPRGGVCMRVELAWRGWRRWYLRRFRSGDVRWMRSPRQGHCPACPHEVLELRDLKLLRNRGGFCWPEREDSFAWRDRLPRAGLAEITIGAALCLIVGTVAWSLWRPATGGTLRHDQNWFPN